LQYMNVNDLLFLSSHIHFYSNSRKDKMVMISEIENRVYSIEIYVSGYTKYWVNGKLYELETGSILLRKPGMIVKQDKNSEYESYSISLEILIKKTGEPLRSSENYCCFFDQLPVKISPENFFDFLRVVRESPVSLRNSTSEKDALATNAIISKLLYLLYPFTQSSTSNEAYIHPAVKKAISYFRANADTNITMKEAADYAGVSEKYFQQVFKEYTGQTPNNYFIDYRMNLAIKKLLTTDMSIAEIAYESGFSSCAYFSQLFKKLYHKTPSEFRKGNKFTQ